MSASGRLFEMARRLAITGLALIAAVLVLALYATPVDG
jgi:hypothetical protein